jgi:hypothetical protein
MLYGDERMLNNNFKGKNKIKNFGVLLVHKEKEKS